MESLSKKPDIKLIIDGKEENLQYLVGCLKRVSEDETDNSHSLTVGRMDINDLLNALRFIAQDVTELVADVTGSYAHAVSLPMKAFFDGFEQAKETIKGMKANDPVYPKGQPDPSVKEDNVIPFPSEDNTPK